MALSTRKAFPPSTGGHVKKKTKKTAVLIVLGLAAAAALFIFLHQGAQRANQITVPYDDVSTVALGDFSNSISVSGIVESASSRMVYSSLAYPVEEIFVEVGDEVTEDTVLCRLDAKALREQIETREVSAGISSAASAQTVKTASDSYSSARDAVDKGVNASLVSAESGVKTAYESWQKAKTSYENYASTLSDGLNATLISQDGAVTSSANALESARAAYSDALDALDKAQRKLDDFDPDTSAYDASIKQAKIALSEAKEQLSLARDDLGAAQLRYQEAYDAYAQEPSPENLDALNEASVRLSEAEAAYSSCEKAKTSAMDALDSAQSQRQSFLDSTYDAYESERDARQTASDNARRSLDAAQSNYDTAVKSREAAYRSADTALADYASAADSAYSAYESALAAYDAAKAGVDSSLQASYNSLQSAVINSSTELSDLELENLYEDLEDTGIKAGANGTVTAVYAKVGASGSGLLFVVEDTGDLVIETSVKEYDIASVKPGMPVRIKSEGTGSDVYQGEILSVAPAATKNSLGQTNSGDVEFAVKVKVTSADTALRIGMNVRLSLVIDEAENVMSVPYDAVYTNSSGRDCIMVLQEQEDGSLVLRELEITRGMENDTDVVISGEGLSRGMQVISEPSGYTDKLGMTVQLTANVYAAFAVGG